jgi:hypothetical protein
MFDHFNLVIALAMLHEYLFKMDNIYPLIILQKRLGVQNGLLHVILGVFPYRSCPG